MTIAQQLNIKTFPFYLYDHNGNVIYHENSDCRWWMWEYDEENMLIYHESHQEIIIDKRPKPEITILGHWHNGGDK
jgi:hypothetical protein